VFDDGEASIIAYKWITFLTILRIGQI
jgi:hypothetical protein